MASVHLGRREGPFGFSRVVAIKQLHGSLSADAQVVSMLVDEARLAASIRHPNVVATLDLLSHHDEIFVVLEYVEGESLSALLRACHAAGEAIPVGIVLALGRDVLAGLAAAHDARDAGGQPLAIVHRDVSPQNVLVGTDGSARLIDFGIAKAVGRLQVTQGPVVKGKAGYMAPEQVQGRPVDRRTDLFAVGVLLWELLTGQRLFDGETDSESALRLLTEAPAPPGQLRAELSPRLDGLVLRALQRDPAFRFPDAASMARELEACGTAAPPVEVGAWVQRLAAPALAERQALLRAGAAARPLVSLAPGPARGEAPQALLAGQPLPAPRAPRRWVAVLGAALLLGLAAALGVWSLRRPSLDAPQPQPTASALPPVQAEAKAPTPTPTAPPPRQAPAAVVAPPHVQATPTSSKRRGPKGTGCNPPYAVTRDGHKHFKPECL